MGVCAMVGGIDAGVCTIMGGINGAGEGKGMKQNWTAPGRSSRPGVFCKKGNFAKFTEKHLCQGLFFGGVAGLGSAALGGGETLAQMFSCEFCKVFKNSFSHNTPPLAASGQGFYLTTRICGYQVPLYLWGIKTILKCWVLY